MVSERCSHWEISPLCWLITAIVLAFASGLLCASHSLWWIFLAVCSFIYGILMLRRELLRVNKRLHYVMESTLSGDFSYKFPVSEVSSDEKEVNVMLNRIVEHLECITKESRQNEVFLGRLINLTDVGMMVADSNGSIRLHNDSALRLLDRPALTHICQIPEQSGTNIAIYKREVSVDDKSFTLYTVTDLSRQIQAVEVESWEKLTRVLTHEIMNSLTPIQSIAETMNGKTSEPEVTDAFATISSSSGSLMEFVKNFRKFSRLPEPHMKVIYIKPLLESIMKMAESYASEKKADISITCFPPDLMLYTDETLLRQVLLNILRNAVEAHSEHIEIEANIKTDDSVEITISNDGDPIPEEMATQIFTPFFSTRENGNGIGLSLSRRIVTHLGGSLNLKIRPNTSFSVKI